MDFKIENTKITISPEQPQAIRFFIQYKANSTIPKLKFIRFNGREICQVEPTDVERIDPVKDIGFDELQSDGNSRTTARSTTTTSRNYNKQQTTQYQWYQTEKAQTTTNALYWTQTTPAPTTTTTLKPQYWTERTTENPRTTQKSQYWQQTTATLKPLYWTQAVTEAKVQTTLRTPVWSYVKNDNNQQGTTTVKPRAESTDRNRTVSSQTQSQGQNNRQTSSGNRYQPQNEVKKTTTVNPPVWPNVKVVNESVSLKDTLAVVPQIVVKQVGQTKYWSKIPAENITGSTWTGSQDLQNQPYAKVSQTRPAESTQNLNQPKDTPLYVRPEDRPSSGNRYEGNNNVENRPQSYSGSENRQPSRPVESYQQTDQRQPDIVRPVKIQGDSNTQSWSSEKTSNGNAESYQPYVQPGV